MHDLKTDHNLSEKLGLIPRYTKSGRENDIDMRTTSIGKKWSMSQRREGGLLQPNVGCMAVNGFEDRDDANSEPESSATTMRIPSSIRKVALQWRSEYFAKGLDGGTHVTAPQVDIRGETQISILCKPPRDVC